MEQATCKTCGEIKPVGSFEKNANTRCGHYLSCKSCRLVVRRAWLDKNPERVASWKRNPTKPSEARREYARNYSRANREQMAVKESAWRRDNAEKVRNTWRRWYQKDVEHARRLARLRSFSRRARMFGNGVFDVSERDLRRALARAANLCAYCAAPLGEDFHWDHVVPISRGGRHSIGNLVPSCPPCNLSKNMKFAMEWRKARL